MQLGSRFLAILLAAGAALGADGAAPVTVRADGRGMELANGIIRMQLDATGRLTGLWLRDGANLLAVLAAETGAVFNVGGGQRVSLREALDGLQAILAEEVPGLEPVLRYEEMAKGDVRHTFADRAYIEKSVGYRPLVPFDEGLRREVRWAVGRRRRDG